MAAPVSTRTVQPFSVALPIPPVLQPTHSDGTRDFYEIVQREAWAEILPGVRTRIWGYNGATPGPTIRARRGRTTVVSHTNRLDVPTVTHLHGGITRPESDGFPTDTVAPGETRRYEYANNGRAATLWYHDHSHRGAGRALYMGLAGFYLLDDDHQVNGVLPQAPHDIPLMLQDRNISADGELDYDHDAHHGAAGDVLLVNGAPWPVLDVAARKYRFRILNASNATAFRLALSDGIAMCQVGSDGGLLLSPVFRRSIDLAMGERADIVIDFSRCPVGTSVILHDEETSRRHDAVMRFDVVRTKHDDSIVPDRLSTIETLDATTATRTRTFVFGAQPVWRIPPAVRWLINGKPFDPARTDAAPRLGDVEVWRFVNRGFMGRTMLHPVHTHLAPFQILERNGVAPPPFERGWKDTVAVNDGEVVDVILRWDGYRGRFLLHCHNLEHEDHSMMARVDVV